MVDALIFFVSLAVLLIAADKLIDAVIEVSAQMGISPMVIGLTVVAIGTSLPEAMASAAAAFEGHPEIAVANVVGSNIANIGLILGLPALYFSVTCVKRTLLREGMLMLAATFLVLSTFFFLGGMGRVMGLLFLLAFATFVGFAFHGDVIEGPAEIPEERHSLGVLGLRVIVAFACLLLSSVFLVESTISLAQLFGISEKVIAISLVAFGTSVPELSVSISAARKGQGDILVGNVLGSNISNILLVLGLTAVINPFTTTQVVGALDLVVMMLFALAMLYFLSKKSGITSARGGLLLASYVLFIVGSALSEFLA